MGGTGNSAGDALETITALALGTGLVPYQEIEKLGEKAELKLLKKQIAEITEFLADAEAGIEQMESALNGTFHKEVNEVNALEAELKALLREHLGIEDPDEEMELTSEEIAHLNRIQAELKDAEREQAEKHAKDTFRNNKKLGKNTKGGAKLREVWRKISMLTHPDRTDNEELHELFHEARTAYLDNDLDRLREILLHIVSHGSVLLRSLSERLGLARTDLAAKKKQAAAVRKTEEYEMWRDWCVPENRKKVESHFQRKLRTERLKFMSALVQLHQEMAGKQNTSSGAKNEFRPKSKSPLSQELDDGDELSPWS